MLSRLESRLVFSVMANSRIGLVMEETLVDSKSSLIGKNLIESNLRKDYGVIIVAIKKISGQMIFNPQPIEKLDAGGVIAVQTFNSHLHIIATDGCFYENGMFIKGSAPAAKDLEDAFRREVFALLKKEGKINDFIIQNMMNWHHSGFNIYWGKTLWPGNEEERNRSLVIS